MAQKWASHPISQYYELGATQYTVISTYYVLLAYLVLICFAYLVLIDYRGLTELKTEMGRFLTSSYCTDCRYY